MPFLDHAFLLSLKDDSYTNYPVFIETGTLNGDTIFAMEPYFNHLFTVEISESYFHKTRAKYQGNKIEFLHGDSAQLFKELLPLIVEPCIFFLDGHYSSGDTGRGEKDCPLIEEITHIQNLYRSNAIIIIDDFRLFGQCQNEDWHDIHKETILDILKSRIEKVYHLDSTYAPNDRLVIHISKYTKKAKL
jgi:hypothetical protein